MNYLIFEGKNFEKSSLIFYILKNLRTQGDKKLVYFVIRSAIEITLPTRPGILLMELTEAHVYTAREQPSS